MSFKCRLKDDKDDNCLTVTGRLFHARGPATEKAHSPAFVFVRGTINWPSDADRSVERRVFVLSGIQSSCRYPGASLWRDLYTITHSLKVIRSQHRSQWSSSRSSGVMWSYRGARHTSLAVALKSDCNLSSWQDETPTNNYYNSLTSWQQTHLLMF